MPERSHEDPAQPEIINKKNGYVEKFFKRQLTNVQHNPNFVDKKDVCACVKKRWMFSLSGGIRDEFYSLVFLYMNFLQ